MNKRNLFLPVLVLLGAAALLVAGCALDGDAKVGSLSFSFSPTARALETGESYRVDVYYGLELYGSQETTDSTITFTAIPTGKATVLVAQGKDSGGGFVARKYGSLEVNMAPGTNTPPAMTLEDVPFHAAESLAGAEVKSVVALDGKLYAATADSLLARGSYSGGTLSVSDGPEVPEGSSVESLSVASFFGGEDYEQQVWVNGSWSPGVGEVAAVGGIMPWDTVDDSLNLEFSSGFDLDANWSGAKAPFTVFLAGSFPDPAGTPEEDGVAVFFEREAGIGGVYLKRGDPGLPTRASWPWITNQIDLSSLLSALGEGDLILDFAMGTNALYAVTALSTLKVSSGVLDPENAVTGDNFLESGYVGSAQGLPAAAISVAVHPEDAGDLIYLGTEDGLFRGTTDPGKPSVFFAAAPVRVPGTAGYAIRKIAISPDGEHVAFVSDRGEGADFLVVKVVGAADSTVYRTLEGLPGESLTSIAWLNDATLLVAGKAGLAALDID